jgi:hypothetical protein
MPALTFPTGIFQNKSTGRSLPNGKMYVGTTDLDPEILANRVNVTVIQENGTPVVVAPAAQPFLFNAAGMLQYNGSVVQMRVSGDASMKILDANDVEQGYFPSITAGAEVSTSIINLIAGTTPTPVAGTGIVYTKMIDGIAELFYMDSIGQELQFTSNGQFNIDLAQSIIEVLQMLVTQHVAATQFRGAVIILEPDEDGNVEMDLTLGQNYYLEMDAHVPILLMTNAPDGKTPNPILLVKNNGAYNIGTLYYDGVPSASNIRVPDTFDDNLSPPHSSLMSYGIAIFPGPEFMFYPVLMKDYEPA